MMLTCIDFPRLIRVSWQLINHLKKQILWWSDYDLQRRSALETEPMLLHFQTDMDFIMDKQRLTVSFISF